MADIQIPINLDPQISNLGTPDVYLRLREFNSFIDKHGYPCYHDFFIPCPCKQQGLNSPNLSCSNCFGSGWTLVSRHQTKIMFQQMNRDTQYKDWSIELVGTVSITTVSTDRPHFMDRYVLYKEEDTFSEIIYPVILQDKVYAFCSYPPKNIEAIYMYNGDNQPLMQLDVSQVVIDNEGGRIDLTNFRDILYSRDSYVFKNVTGLTIVYTFMPSYHVIDTPRNLMVSPDQDTSTKVITRATFPYHAIGRLSHLVIDRSNLINFAQGYQNNAGEGNSAIDDMVDHDTAKEFCDVERPFPKDRSEDSTNSKNIDILNL